MLRVAGYAVLRTLSFFPLQCIRIAALRIAGAAIGKDVVLKTGVEVLAPWRLSIGPHSIIGRRVRLDARGNLSIGDNVNISDDAAIWTAEHDVHSPDFATRKEPVVVANRVWICFRATILPGVCLGEGAVAATGSVVTKDVAPLAIAAGIPGRVVGWRTPELNYELGKLRI